MPGLRRCRRSADRLFIDMFMDNGLLNLLYHRLPGRSVPAVRAGIGEIDSLTFGADLLCLSGFYAAIRAESAVKLVSAVFTDMQEHSRAAGRAMLFTVIDLCATELTCLQFSVLQ